VTTAKIADDNITTALIADDNITSALIADDNILTAHILDANVTTAKLAAGAVTNGAKIATGQALIYSGGSDPGAVGAGAVWFDTTASQTKVRNAGNSAWIILGQRTVPLTSYTPSLTNVTLGTGGVSFGRYSVIGKVVSWAAGFRLGTGGNVTGLISIGLPTDYPAATTADVGFVVGAWADTGSRWAGAGIIVGAGSPNTETAGRVVNAGIVIGWDATSPEDWASTDYLAMTGWYETTG